MSPSEQKPLQSVVEQNWKRLLLPLFLAKALVVTCSSSVVIASSHDCVYAAQDFANLQ